MAFRRGNDYEVAVVSSTAFPRSLFALRHPFVPAQLWKSVGGSAFVATRSGPAERLVRLTSPLALSTVGQLSLEKSEG